MQHLNPLCLARAQEPDRGRIHETHTLKIQDDLGSMALHLRPQVLKVRCPEPADQAQRDRSSG